MKQNKKEDGKVKTYYRKQFRQYEVDTSNLVDLQTETIDGLRYYKTPKGSFPSVTSVMSIRPKPHLEQWKNSIGEEEAATRMRRAATRGTNLHNTAEAYIKNDPAFDQLIKNPFTNANFEIIKPILDDLIDDIISVEVPLYSSYLKTAGRCDLICHFGDPSHRTPTIVDYKGKNRFMGEGYYHEYYKQIAAYKTMFKELTGIDIKQGVVIYMVEGDRAHYEVIDPDKWVDEFKKDRGYFFKLKGH